MAGDWFDRVKWTEGKPRKSGLYVPILRADFTNPPCAYITSEQLLQVECHWIPVTGKDGQERGHSFPCLEGECEYCAAGLKGLRAKGYLAGIQDVRGQPVLLELTAGAIRACPMLTQKAVSLRGMKITLHRTSPKKGSRSYVKLGEGCNPTSIGQPFQLKRILRKLWSLPPTGDQVDGLELAKDDEPPY